MQIWIDLGNSPHVPFFLALSKEFERRGHAIFWTARDYAQTVELAEKAGLPIETFGTHGGKGIIQKGLKFAGRTWQLFHWARGEKIDLVVSHNSHEPLAVARILGVRSVNLMDYEHHPMNHLSFRLAKRVIVPDTFPLKFLKKFGAVEAKVKRFEGLKEDVYLSNFKPDPTFWEELRKLGISPENILIVVRPHAPEALYHRDFSNKILDALLDKFAGVENVRIVLLPRKEYQGKQLKKQHPQPNIIIPPGVLDGANLIAAADLIVSGGGTMNREAAALGIPVFSIFAGKPAAIDQMLIDQGRMKKLATPENLADVELVKKPKVIRYRNLQTKQAVADLILENW